MSSMYAFSLPTYALVPLFAPHELNMDMNLMQDIDDELRRACEAVIAFCADAACGPLRSSSIRTSQSSASPSPAAAALSQTNQDEVLAQFTTAVHRDLRATVFKLSLYLEDDRTVAVLVKHAGERIVDEFIEFRRASTLEVGGQGGRMGEREVRVMLDEVCAVGASVGAEGGDASGGGSATKVERLSTLLLPLGDYMVAAAMRQKVQLWAAGP